jgi:hypothetical protein
MGQNALTVIVPVKSEELAPLRELLTDIGQDIEDNPHVRFADTPSTHFARWVILDRPNERPRLLFTSNYDGTFDSYMRELVTRIGAGMEPVWNKCAGYTPGSSQDVGRFSRFIQQHSLPCQTFYVAFPGIGVERIAQCGRIREMIDQLLDAREAAPWLTELTALLPPASTLDIRPSPSPSLRGVPGAGSKPAELSPAARLVECLVGVRPGVNPNRRVTTPVEQVAMEDLVVQNQMTVIVPIKRQLWPQIMLRIVLAAVTAKARQAFGSLAGLQTIHFARWAIIDNGRNLLFESNYDGSWENYIDDFVDDASLGMEAIWANCEGFPIGGCRDIEWFKTYIRENQIAAQVFYSAYPQSTVKNIMNDLQISGAALEFLQRQEVREFLSGAYGSPPVVATAKLLQEREVSAPCKAKPRALAVGALSALCLVGFYLAVRRAAKSD